MKFCSYEHVTDSSLTSYLFSRWDTRTSPRSFETSIVWKACQSPLQARLVQALPLLWVFTVLEYPGNGFETVLLELAQKLLLAATQNDFPPEHCKTIWPFSGRVESGFPSRLPWVCSPTMEALMNKRCINERTTKYDSCRLLKWCLEFSWATQSCKSLLWKGKPASKSVQPVFSFQPSRCPFK